MQFWPPSPERTLPSPASATKRTWQLSPVLLDDKWEELLGSVKTFERAGLLLHEQLKPWLPWLPLTLGRGVTGEGIPGRLCFWSFLPLIQTPPQSLKAARKER